MLTFTNHTIPLAPRAPTLPRAPRGLVRRVLAAVVALFGGRVVDASAVSTSTASADRDLA